MSYSTLKPSIASRILTPTGVSNFDPSTSRRVKQYFYFIYYVLQIIIPLHKLMVPICYLRHRILVSIHSLKAKPTAAAATPSTIMRSEAESLMKDNACKSRLGRTRVLLTFIRDAG